MNLVTQPSKSVCKKKVKVAKLLIDALRYKATFFPLRWAVQSWRLAARSTWAIQLQQFCTVCDKHTSVETHSRCRCGVIITFHLYPAQLHSKGWGGTYLLRFVANSSLFSSERERGVVYFLLCYQCWHKRVRIVEAALTHLRSITVAYLISFSWLNGERGRAVRRCMWDSQQKEWPNDLRVDEVTYMFKAPHPSALMCKFLFSLCWCWQKH